MLARWRIAATASDRGGTVARHRLVILQRHIIRRRVAVKERTPCGNRLFNLPTTRQLARAALSLSCGILRRVLALVSAFRRGSCGEISAIFYAKSQTVERCPVAGDRAPSGTWRRYFYHRRPALLQRFHRHIVMGFAVPVTGLRQQFFTAASLPVASALSAAAAGWLAPIRHSR